MKLLIGLWLACVLAVTVLAQKQDDIKVVSRIPNVTRIVRNWNALSPATTEWNSAMQKAEALVHERFNPKVVVVNPDDKRRAWVGHLKAAREALLKQVEALNELIDEDEY